LHLVTKHNHTEEKPFLVKLLTEKGADLNATDHMMRTPLHYLAEMNEKVNYNVLVAAGADENAKDDQNLSPKEMLSQFAADDFEIHYEE